MTWEVTPDDPTTKTDHLRAVLKGIDPEVFQGIPTYLIVYTEEALVVALGRDNKFETLHEVLAGVENSAGSNFESALGKAMELIGGEAGIDPILDRTALFLSTDGDDYGERDQTIALASELRDMNAAMQCLGVGYDWNHNHIYDIASAAGYSAWSHTPMKDGNDKFGSLVTSLISELRTSEHYLKVIAPKTFAGFYGQTPAIREVVNHILYMGYQREPIGVFFSKDPAPFLELEFGRSVSDPAAQRKPIPIIDHKSAGTHFEQLKKSKT